MQERLYAVRGATQVEHDDPQMIRDAVLEMYDTLYAANGLDVHRIVSVQFTVTQDLRSLNPATALRSREGSDTFALFCMQEPDIAGMLERTIRMLVYYYHDLGQTPKAVYLRGARQLRPDLIL